MKNRFTRYTLLCFFGLFSQAQAQDAAVEVDDDPRVLVESAGGYSGSFHFGLVTGLNNTWIKFDNEEQNNEHYQYKTAFKWAPIGLALGYKFNDRHDLQAEAYVSRQGQHYDLVANGDGSGEVIGEKRLNLTYLQVPLLWKYSSGDATRFNVHFGGQVGFLLRGEEINEITRTGGKHRNETAIPTGTTLLASKKGGDNQAFDTYGKFNTLDPSLVLGFGLEKDLTDNLYLSGNLRFNYGFADIRAGETVVDKTTGDKYILRYNIFGGAQVGLHYILRKP
ncbi:MAG: porin family protein [Adhaeribacter sp.]